MNLEEAKRKSLVARVETWRIMEGLTHTQVLDRLVEIGKCRDHAEADQLLNDELDH